MKVKKKWVKKDESQNIVKTKDESYLAFNLILAGKKTNKQKTNASQNISEWIPEICCHLNYQFENSGDCQKKKEKKEGKVKGLLAP